MPNAPKPPVGARPTVSATRGTSRSHSRSRGGPHHLTNPGVTTAIGTRPSEPSVSKAAIEAGAERVFMTHPRMFSFSHRCLQSLRHPFLAAACVQVDVDLAKVKRQWQTRAERLSDTLTEGTSSIRHEDARWVVIGRMLDGVLCRDYIAERRQAALENVSLRRSLENWWCKVGGTTTKGVSESAYKQVHKTLYTIILQTNDTTLESVITKAIESDWQQDSQGSGEVPFGRWYISLLEIADTWVAKCDGEAYGLFLDALLKSVFPQLGQPRGSATIMLKPSTGGMGSQLSGYKVPVSNHPTPAATPLHSEVSGGGATLTPIPVIKADGDEMENNVSSGNTIFQPEQESNDPSFMFEQRVDADKDSELWAGVVNSLRETALTMQAPPLVRAKRNVRGIVEYEKAVFVPPPPGVHREA